MKGYSRTAQFGKLWGLPALVLGIVNLVVAVQSPVALMSAGLVGAKAKMLLGRFSLTGLGVGVFFSNVWRAAGGTLRDFMYFLQDVLGIEKQIRQPRLPVRR